jgi:cellulose synthase/poly-beta-1,6-N-acetylglucosamine synthase-like glycosyltransferase
MITLVLLARVLAIAVAVPCAVLLVECLAALLPRRRSGPIAGAPRTVVLVPAHDEQDCLPEALRSLESEIGPGDRIVVVAHNCSDGTADVARAAGVQVVEARDAGTGGKPDALKAGLRALDSDPPDVVVIVDADCRVAPGAIRALAQAAHAHGGPVQGDYRFGGHADSNSSISSLALLVKNVVRPSGLMRLGLPCLLNGAGSAYPFEQLRHAPHGEGSIAEDYQLAIDLALRGHFTRFVPEARVESVLPERRDSALRQRRRWEHGHLALVLRTAPGLILRGLVSGRLGIVTLGLDLLVPPLAFLVLAWALSAGVALAAAALAGERAAAWIALFAGAGMGTAVLAGIARFAGLRTAWGILVLVPRYVLWKIPLYLGFARRRETRWRKTERT